MLYDVIFWAFLLLFLFVVVIIVIKNVSKNNRATRAHKQGRTPPAPGLENNVTESHNMAIMIIGCPECGAKNSVGQRLQSNQKYRCGKCGAEIVLLQTTDTQDIFAEVPLKVEQPETLTFAIENTSGQGKLTVVPNEIKRWNWGAFLLGVIWGAGNNVWWSLLILIPYFDLIWIFVMGVKGSEWAWKNKEWDSIEHFKRTQKKWRDWGIVITVIIAFVYFIIAFY